MFQTIKRFYNETLHALDGEIGHVKDFYFDDQKWAIRYVVVLVLHIGWLVLLAPMLSAASIETESPALRI